MNFWKLFQKKEVSKKHQLKTKNLYQNLNKKVKAAIIKLKMTNMNGPLNR